MVGERELYRGLGTRPHELKAEVSGVGQVVIGDVMARWYVAR